MNLNLSIQRVYRSLGKNHKTIQKVEKNNLKFRRSIFAIKDNLSSEIVMLFPTWKKAFIGRKLILFPKISIPDSLTFGLFIWF